MWLVDASELSDQMINLLHHDLLKLHREVDVTGGGMLKITPPADIALGHQILSLIRIYGLKVHFATR